MFNINVQQNDNLELYSQYDDVNRKLLFPSLLSNLANFLCNNKVVYFCAITEHKNVSPSGSL